LGYADITIRKNSKGNLTTSEKDDKGKENKIIRRVSLIDAPGLKHKVTRLIILFSFPLSSFSEVVKFPLEFFLIVMSAYPNLMVIPRFNSSE
jgi:hypothetical protein